MKDYKTLNVWKKTTELAIEVVKMMENFENKIPNALIFQIQKSAISIPSNIAEVVGRQYKKETIQFLNIARGSLYELETQVEILVGLNIIEKKKLNSLIEKIIDCIKLTNGFINYYKSNSNLS
jgi:four helix bundle protein